VSGPSGADDDVTGSFAPDFSKPVPHGVLPEVPGVRLEVQIGRGGYATVYRARQISVDRDVAVKVDDRRLIQDRDKRRFTREIVAAGAVSAHPHIVTVYDGGTTADDHPFLVMEYYTGGSYSDRIKKSGSVPPAEVLEVGIGIADALSVAHADGILHRDVKPGNILISRYGTPALADFGLAALPRAAEGFSVTMESLTPSYAPPEAFSGADPTASMDIYSLGVTLYALLVGRAPRSDKSGTVPPLARLLFMLNDPLPFPDIDGAEAIMPVIWRATMFDPAQRYASANALHDALLEVRSGATAQAGVRPTPPRPLPLPPAPVGLVPQRAAAAEDTSSSGPLSLFGHSNRADTATGQPMPPVKAGRRWWWVIGTAAAVVALVVAGLVVFGGRTTTGGVAQAGAVTSSASARSTTSAPHSANQAEPTPTHSGVPIVNVPSQSAFSASQPGSASPDPSRVDRSSIGTAATAAAAASNAAPSPTTGPLAARAKPKVGTCWSGLVNISGQITAESLSCSRPHYWEAYAIGVLASATTSPLAKDVAHDPVIAKTCTAADLKSYLGPASAGTFNLEVLPPTIVDFSNGDKGFWCLASIPGAGRVTGSLRSN
jgi:serine/threonine protein kinase